MLRWTSLAATLAVGALLTACGGVTANWTAGPGATAARPTSPVATTPASAATPAAPPRVQGNLTVFTAASLTDAFTEIGKAIEADNPGTTVIFNFAGSQVLRTQLREGARADVFASADEPTMQGAREDGSIAGDPSIFIHNKLVAIVASQKAGEISRLEDLSRPGVKLTLAQESVPVGNYSRQALTKMENDATYGAGFSQRTLANLVSQEANVRQVVTKVQLGEADAGIVYSSDVTAAARAQVEVIDIPDQFNVIARYPIAVTRGAANADGARAFIDYVLSPAGQATLEKHGFIPMRLSTSQVGRGDE